MRPRRALLIYAAHEAVDIDRNDNPDDFDIASEVYHEGWSER